MSGAAGENRPAKTPAGARKNPGRGIASSPEVWYNTQYVPA